MTEKQTEAVAELLATSEGRRALSIQSPVFFDTYYCGMRFAKHREVWLETFHKTMHDAKERNKKNKLMVLAPRDHGKTEAGVSVALRTICLNRNVRILWICESSTQAEKRMRRVKSLLESDLITGDWCSAEEDGYGPFRKTDNDRWMSTQVYVHRSLQSVDPTLEAVGANSSVTGGHFDLIIADDLEDDRTVYSASQRKKTRDWFRGTISPMLSVGGTMVVIGTRKHHDDLYSHIIGDPTFRIMQDKAISRWPDSYKFLMEKDQYNREVITGVKIDGDADVLWKEERPIEYLLQERQSVGSRLFAREFQNEVQDDSAAAFRMEWLETAKSKGKEFSLYKIPDIEGLDIVQGWDLALVTDSEAAENRDTDFTVGVTWGRDPEGNRYLLGLCRRRGLSQAQLQAVVVQEYLRFNSRPRIVAVEKNNFGELHFMGLQRSTDLPLKPHLTTGKNKADPWDGVPSLSVLFENGKVILPTGDLESRDAIKPLVDELWGLGRERHDDTVMALWIAETVLRKNSFVYQVSFCEGVEFEGVADERAIGSDGGEALAIDPVAKEAQDKHLEGMWGNLPVDLDIS